MQTKKKTKESQKDANPRSSTDNDTMAEGQEGRKKQGESGPLLFYPKCPKLKKNPGQEFPPGQQQQQQQ